MLDKLFRRKEETAERLAGSPETLLAEEKYRDIIAEREKIYRRNLEGKPGAEGMEKALKKHNKVVLYYACELVKLEENLKPEEEAAVLIGAILHDVGKGDDSFLADHHERGAKYAEEILNKYLAENKEFGGTRLTEEIKKLSVQGIERHMNHPYMVKYVNKGESYPRPETAVDRIVYSADMLANVGFKNMAFRLGSENNLATDKEVAEEQGITQLEAIAENVVGGAESLLRDIGDMENESGSKMLTDGARLAFGRHIANIKEIFARMKLSGVFDRIHSELDEKYHGREIKLEYGAYIMQRLNEEIERAARAINRDKLKEAGKEKEMEEAIDVRDGQKAEELSAELGLIGLQDIRHYQM